MKSTIPLDTIEKIPKIELHLHFEGSIDSQMHNEFDSKGYSIQNRFAKPEFDSKDFSNFLSKIRYNYNFLTSIDHYTFFLELISKRLQQDNVKYCEINFNFGWIYSAFESAIPLFEVLWKEAEIIRERYGILLRFIADCPWQFNDSIFREIIDQKDFFMKHGLVGVDLAGDERYMNLDKFKKTINYLRADGLGILIHAGETLKVFTLPKLISVINPHRIRHALLYKESINLLKSKGICIDIALNSNLSTGAIKSFKDHIIHDLYSQNIPFSIGTDDPGLFNTNLSQELKLCSDILNFNIENLLDLQLNQLNYLFLDDKIQKEELKLSIKKYYPKLDSKI